MIIILHYRTTDKVQKPSNSEFVLRRRQTRLKSTSHSIISGFLPSAPVSAVEDSKAIERLKASNCGGTDGTPSFIIMKCSHIFIPLLPFILNFNATSETIP
jgi:hypothetical protein